MGQKSILISIVIIIFAVIFVVLFILSRASSSKNNAQNAAKARDAKVVTKTIVSAPDIINDPLVYDGLTVEVESQITDWVTKRSFTLSASEQGLLGRQGQLLVVSKSAFKLPKKTTGKEVGLGETVNVRVKGKARIMDRVELGRALGLNLDGEDIKLDDNNISQWREGSVLLLDSVEKL